MDRKKKIAIVLLLLAVVVAAVLCFLLLDELAAQLICILAAMILAAVVLVLSMDHSALHALVLAAATAVCVPFLKFFEHSELAARLCGRYNDGTAFVCTRMGMEAPKEMGSQTALIITFWIIFALTYLIVWGVRSWIKGKTAAGSGGSEQDKDFLERTYPQKKKSFCEYLDIRIRDINKETDWSAKTYTPIEAEVEMTDKRRRKRRYEDLHKCLRRHRRKNTVFLVLGDPGAGKSVSMRKLCADMMKDVKKTDLIPVYVDLKRWTEDWSLERLPTEENLIAFIERILREDGTNFEGQFLKAYFRKMLVRGNWYFVFDSFDEMPCLMGRKNCQELIDHISSLLHTFLTKGNQRGGVIASRLFRSPTDALEAAIKLNLQPFSDAKIKRMLKLYTNNSDELVRLLFSGREDLVALCRNPFYLSLLIEYSTNHGAALPGNQMDLYEDFIQSRLKECVEKIDELGLKDIRQVRDAARQLALYMQESTKYGLECPLSELYRRNDGYEWQKILELLRYARLCRFGGASSTVSFVHRRFQECFYVSNIKENRIRLDRESYSSIEKNNGIRDALVLYCEIAPLEKAREIADHCWSVLQTHKAAARSIRNPGCVELVNTLYFMAEAFRNRREAMAHFQTDFQKFTLKMLKTQEFVVQYAAVSSMVLFEQPELLKMVLEVLRKENRYLSGIVMKNCRTMTEIPWEISHKMALHLANMDQRTFMRQFLSMDFSLSLSKQLRYVRLVHAVRLVYDVLCQLSLKILGPVLMIWILLWEANFSSLFDNSINANTLVVLSASIVWMSFIITDMRPHEIGLIGLDEHALMRSVVLGLLLLVPIEVVAGFTAFWWVYVPACIAVILYVSVLWGTQFFNGLRRMTVSRLGDMVKALCKFIYSCCVDIYQLFAGDKKKAVRVCLLLVIGGFPAYILLSLPRRWQLSIMMLAVGGFLGMQMHILVKQRRWLRKQLPVTTMDRSVLGSNLVLHLKGGSIRKQYLEDLVERKVKLTGEWPDGRRPEMYRDDEERLLAVLDCGDIENLRVEF